MKIGIDASNLLLGGGVTHLDELLRAADPERHRFSEVIVWGRRATLDRLPQKPWLILRSEPELERNLLRRSLWRMRRLDGLLRQAGCDLLFVPGGSYLGAFRPFVTMSRNLLPFDDAAVHKYGFSWMRLKMRLLRRVQTATFRSASGVIFLTASARNWVTRVTGSLPGRTEIIPHGISSRFSRNPSPQLPLEHYSIARPFRLLYVSNLQPYKHHAPLVAAVRTMRDEGYPLALDLVGAGSIAAEQELKRIVDEAGGASEGIAYHGSVNYSALPGFYHRADVFVFASSCENLPNILLEAMAAGLPIACSNRSVMPEVLGEAGLYFDPESPQSMSQALKILLNDPALRARLGEAARRRVADWSWPRCADMTFAFFQQFRPASAKERSSPPFMKRGLLR
jgi:glycosyltransferase involved in cell wall biosynthesis